MRRDVRDLLVTLIVLIGIVTATLVAIRKDDYAFGAYMMSLAIYLRVTYLGTER